MPLQNHPVTPQEEKYFLFIAAVKLEFMKGAGVQCLNPTWNHQNQVLSAELPVRAAAGLLLGCVMHREGE